MAYIYRHIRLDKNKVFYVGISNDKTYVRPYKKDGRNSIWNHIVNKTTYEVEIILDNLTWEEAKIKEIEFITLYGKLQNHTGTLANITDGGGGTPGWVMPSELKSRLPQLWKKGNKIPEDQLVRLIATRTSWYKHTEETRRKIGISNKGKIISSDIRVKISKTLKSKKLISPNRKLVLNIETGIYYESIELAANSLDIQRKYLSRKLSGSRRNDTPMSLV